MSDNQTIPRLFLRNFPEGEIIHYYSETLQLTSQANHVFVTEPHRQIKFSMPLFGISRYAAAFRLIRRAARLDKCNITPIFKDSILDSLIVIYQGNVYHFDIANEELSHTLRLRQCRNILHQSICITDKGHIYFGEYGHNRKRNSVPIYRSTDCGNTWDIAFEFPPNSIKHIHGCYWDEYENSIWVCTGDFAGENRVLQTNDDFTSHVVYGDGSQAWRTCCPFFLKDIVIWGMDSQLETSHLCIFDRQKKTLQKDRAFPGPIWYGKQFIDGGFLLASANEVGPGVLDNYAHIFFSTDGLSWSEVFRVKKDWWPKRYFKFGVLGFADGPQKQTDFAIFGEALSGMDGKVFLCTLEI